MRGLFVGLLTFGALCTTLAITGFVAFSNSSVQLMATIFGAILFFGIMSVIVGIGVNQDG